MDYWIVSEVEFLCLKYAITFSLWVDLHKLLGQQFKQANSLRTQLAKGMIPLTKLLKSLATDDNRSVQAEKWYARVFGV